MFESESNITSLEKPKYPRSVPVSGTIKTKQSIDIHFSSRSGSSQKDLGRASLPHREDSSEALYFDNLKSFEIPSSFKRQTNNSILEMIQNMEHKSEERFGCKNSNRSGFSAISFETVELEQAIKDTFRSLNTVMTEQDEMVKKYKKFVQRSLYKSVDSEYLEESDDSESMQVNRGNEKNETLKESQFNILDTSVVSGNNYNTICTRKSIFSNLVQI